MTPVLTACLCFAAASVNQSELTLVPEPVHVRSGSEREWSDFPETARADHLDVQFAARRNAGEEAIVIRQQDVKQNWQVTLNGKRLGELTRDENEQLATFAVPAAALVDGENRLRIESKPPSDDVRIGPIVLHHCPTHDLLHAATLSLQVIDGDTQNALPCRITVVDETGALAALGATSDSDHAVRTGVIYAAGGHATFGLPAGRYTVFASRGFEYSLGQTEVTLSPGDSLQRQLVIRREVPTHGYVACDTHIHTLTHSGHGDCTLEERMLTLAGEGIELPIATDHNRQIDYEAVSRQMGVRQYFTPVIGNEVTTSRGHFNIFPVMPGAPVPDQTLGDWAATFDAIDRTPGVKVIILNHARDIHSGVRPFGPVLHNAAVGENLDGWPLRFNAMEVINSGATQTDPLQLLRDWMTLLNRGRHITPVGSSDSHDVSRYIVGQGRTYIRCDDRDPGQIDVDEAVENFLQGRVLVSYGLLAELTVNAKYRSGELARVADEEVRVDVRVLGPEWVRAERVLLFSNGELIREAAIGEAVTDAAKAGQNQDGLQCSAIWMLPKPRHDVHLVAVALGAGVDGLYWRTAKPYQPVSSEWRPYTLGCSGAVWVDADQDGRPTPARDYASRELARSPDDLATLVEHLADYDAAVAAQAAYLFHSAHGATAVEELQQRLRSATAAVRTGFQAYLTALRDSQAARGQRQ